ncbi:MAG: flagellar hook capping protein [Lachnospiraceae bacterium]|nr:flagellar hook capping protein [Lachnospiraceae bacterium]
MSVTASVTDGVLSAQSTVSSSKDTKGGSTMGKDDFLQLLVAQMKYQDPLEPTSNTEYVAQYATFSEVEQMQNMSQNMDLSRASSLVGQTVEITTVSDSGLESTIMGKVDYVKYENGKALLSVNDSLYSLDDVTHVCDQAYLDAMDIAKALLSEVGKLPEPEKLTFTDRERVENIGKVYDAMSTYQKSFLTSDEKSVIENYVEKMRQMVNELNQNADNDNNSDDTTEGTQEQ